MGGGIELSDRVENAPNKQQYVISFMMMFGLFGIRAFWEETFHLCGVGVCGGCRVAY